VMDYGINHDQLIIISFFQVFNVTKCETQIVKPLLRTDNLVSFQVPVSMRSFTSPHIILRTRWRIIKGDGSKLTQNDYVASVCTGHWAMWKQATLVLSESVVSDTTPMGFPLLAYLINRFTLTESARSIEDDMVMGYPDTPGVFNDFEPGIQANQGYWKRLTKTQLSRSVTTQGVIPFAVGQSGRVFPPGVRLAVSLSRAPDSFVLCSANGNAARYKIEIEDIELELQRFRLKDELVRRIYDCWRDVNYISYPHTRLVAIGPYEIPEQTSLINKVINTGQRPSCALIAFVASAAANGSYDSNPFCLEHMQMSKAQMSFESEFYPLEALSPRFPADSDHAHDYCVTREFAALMKCLGFLGENSSNGINMDAFVNGNTLFAFTLNEWQQQAGLVEPLPEAGQLKLMAQMQVPTTRAVQMWVFAAYRNVVRLSSDLVVAQDFGASVPS
jgi:hypothetical protein